MVPGINGFLDAEMEVFEYPSKTYRMQFTENRISGYCTGLEAVKQTIFRILNTERYQYLIYSWNYGVQFADLFGEPVSYVCPEIERRIRDALSCDDRIRSCDAFSFDTQEHGVVKVSFTVQTSYGDLEIDTEVRR